MTALADSIETFHFSTGEFISGFADLLGSHFEMVGSEGRFMFQAPPVTFTLSALPNGRRCLTSFTTNQIPVFSAGYVVVPSFSANATVHLGVDRRPVDVCELVNHGEQWRKLFIVGGTVTFEGPALNPNYPNSLNFTWIPPAKVTASIEFSTTAPPPKIPEPGTLGMLKSGLIGLAGLARRKLKL